MCYQLKIFDNFQNLVGRIMSFFEKGPLSVCILSATGAISNVNIREHAASNHVMRFEVQRHKQSPT